MMLQIRVRPRARSDIKEIMEFIHSDKPRAALRFLAAVEKLAKRLAENPELGACYESDQQEFNGLRVFSVPRYTNYLVFYRVTETEIDIIRVLHGARDLPRVLGNNE
jgi:toxin ParE1/3/4